ncbi:MAG: type IV pilus biogenesis/stability protein PilW [Methylophilaceae bacterium]|nr:MAG: type IV pilus biogenesis/stability protein PilW [Methylophilaceae bacterium]
MHSYLNGLFVAILFCFLSACETTGSQVDNNDYKRTAIIDRARAHTNLGAAYLQKNKLEIALDEFTKAVEIMPTFAMAYNGLAMVRSALGQDAEAEYNFKKAIKLDASISETYNNYGTFLCSRGRYEESITQFLAAVKNPLHGTPSVAYANAGICSKRNGDIKGAERYLNKALEIQPLTHAAAAHLADIQFSRGDAVLAKKTLQNALIAAPTAEVLWLAIKIERLLGDKNNVASYSLELRRKFPNAAETQLLLSGQ